MVSQDPEMAVRDVPLSWRITSTATLAFAGFLSKSFLSVATKSTLTEGMDEFVELLDKRREVERRERGLITVSNHVSVYVSFVLSLARCLGGIVECSIREDVYWQIEEAYRRQWQTFAY